MTTDLTSLLWNNIRAQEMQQVIQSGDHEALQQLLAQDPTLVNVVVYDERGGGRTLLHLFADFPGHRPNARHIVQVLHEAGFDVNSTVTNMKHRESSLHWAASNDDVELIDALIEFGADVELQGASIGGGSALCDAVGYGMMNAARQLVDRHNARTKLWHVAAMGRLDIVKEKLRMDDDEEVLGLPLWQACAHGHIEVVQLLLRAGAPRDWLTPWSNESCLSIATQHGHVEVVKLLEDLK